MEVGAHVATRVCSTPARHRPPARSARRDALDLVSDADHRRGSRHDVPRRCPPHRERHPERAPRRDPRCWPLAAVRESRRVLPSSRRLPPVVARRRSGLTWPTPVALAAQTLRAHDVDTLFTLSGGHLFPLYDGCVKHDVRLVDTRHEQTAAFAAEGWAKVTRRVGVGRADRGSRRHERRQRGDERASQRIAGAGDRRPGAASAVGLRIAPGARPRADPRVDHQAHRHDHVVGRRSRRISTPRSAAARTPHRGPTFLDVPLDAWGPTDVGRRRRLPTRRTSRERCRIPMPSRASPKLIGEARAPVLMVGGDVYWAGAEAEALALIERARIPVFANDLGRGVVAADHELAFSRARSVAFDRRGSRRWWREPRSTSDSGSGASATPGRASLRRPESAVAAHVDAGGVDSRRSRARRSPRSPSTRRRR